MCALHTLNNLFQRANAFTKAQLDELCHQLSPNTWINPHRSMLGLGNYDINIIMAALQTANCDLTWWDKRRKISTEDVESSFGFILNIPSPSRVAGLTLPFKTKHWLAIRRFGSVYYNLDSKLDSPLRIGDSIQLCEYLTKQLNEVDCELFIVVSSSLCTLAVEETT